MNIAIDNKSEVVLGLGSNVGDRLNYLQKAIFALELDTLTDTKLSFVYESDAVLKPNSPAEWNKPYLNMAIRGRTDLTPSALLKRVKRIEEDLGRIDRGRWAPREIDIDILTFGDLVINDESLTIPHPGLTERQFVLLTIGNVTPNWKYPVEGDFFGKTAKEIIERINKKAESGSEHETLSVF